MMKRILMITAILFSFFAKAQSDTTRIKIGEKELEFIVKDKSKTDSIELEIEKEIESAMKELNNELENIESLDSSQTDEWDIEDFSFLAGFGLHTTMIDDGNFTLSAPTSHSFLEAAPFRSINLEMILIDKYVPLYKQHIGLVGGLGFSWSSFAFNQGFELEPGKTGEVTATFDSTLSYNRNKLKMAYLKMPILLQFANGDNPNKSFHIAAGGYAGLRLGRGRNKVEYIDEQGEKSFKTKGEFNLNTIDYGIEAMVGYGNYSLRASYGLAPIFSAETNVEAYPVQFGIIRTF